MKTILGRIFPIKAVCIFIPLICLLLIAILNMSPGRETEEIMRWKLHSFAGIQHLERSEHPLFYDMRMESDVFEEWNPAREIIVFAAFSDGAQKDLFSVSLNHYALFGAIGLHEDESHLYLYRDGAYLDHNTDHVSGEHGYVDRLDSAPFIIQYSKRTGEVSEVALKSKGGIIILDLFSYENKLNYLLEKRTQKPWIIHDTTWANSVGYLEGAHQKQFDFKVVGNTLLNVRGCLVGDDYYFPALDGIYKMNLQSKKVELCLKKDYGAHDYVHIFKQDDSFLVIEQKIAATLYKYNHWAGKEKEVCISAYAQDFQNLIMQAPVNISSIDGAVMGSRGIMLYKYMHTTGSSSKNSITSVYCRFSDFSSAEIPPFSGVDLNLLRWNFIDDTDEFLLVSTKKNEDACQIVSRFQE